MDIRQYLTDKGIRWTEHQRPSGLQGNMICPVCKNKDKSFHVNLENGAFQCPHENTCGITGSWYDLQRLLGDVPRSLDADNRYINTKPRKTYKRPAPIKPLLPNEAAYKFLESRGITRSTANKFKVGITEDGKSITLPFYHNGELVNIKYRSISEKKFWQEKNAEQTLFNRDNISSESTYLIITEGEFDAMALNEYEINAVSIPSGCNNTEWIEVEWEWLERFKEIYLCLDMDEAGQQAVINIVKRLGSWRCRRVELPYKDANECLINKVERHEITSIITNAREFAPALLTKAGNYTQEVIELIQHPDKLRGLDTGFDGLNKILGGWRDAELTIWSGNNGAGKSTIINHVIINLLKQRVPCVIVSLEMKPAKYLRWATMQFLEDSTPDSKSITAAMDFFEQNLYIVNAIEEIDIETLMDVFEYAARRHGVKHFFVDSLMKLKINKSDELNEQKSIVNKLAAFSNLYNVHTHLVAHPRKGSTDKDVPDKVDIAGTGDIANNADNILIMWRPTEELKEKMAKKGNAPDGILFVKKNREEGQEGSIKLYFNVNYKKFKEHI